MLDFLDLKFICIHIDSQLKRGKMHSIRNKQRCAPDCTDHILSLRNLTGSDKYDVTTSFCPKFRREPYPPERTIPQYNLDHKHFTNAFVLGTEKRALASNSQQQHMHFQTMVKDACQKNNQIFFPRPNEKNSYCSVCKEHYFNYYEHIKSEPHREKIDAAIYNTEIERLCQFYRSKWEGAHSKADQILQQLMQQAEMEANNNNKSSKNIISNQDSEEEVDEDDEDDNEEIEDIEDNEGVEANDNENIEEESSNQEQESLDNKLISASSRARRVKAVPSSKSKESQKKEIRLNKHSLSQNASNARRQINEQNLREEMDDPSEPQKQKQSTFHTTMNKVIDIFQPIQKSIEEPDWGKMKEEIEKKKDFVIFLRKNQNGKYAVVTQSDIEAALKNKELPKKSEPQGLGKGKQIGYYRPSSQVEIPENKGSQNRSKQAQKQKQYATRHSRKYEKNFPQMPQKLQQNSSRPSHVAYQAKQVYRPKKSQSNDKDSSFSLSEQQEREQLLCERLKKKMLKEKRKGSEANKNPKVVRGEQNVYTRQSEQKNLVGESYSASQMNSLSHNKNEERQYRPEQVPPHVYYNNYGYGPQNQKREGYPPPGASKIPPMYPPGYMIPHQKDPQSNSKQKDIPNPQGSYMPPLMHPYYDHHRYMGYPVPGHENPQANKQKGNSKPNERSPYPLYYPPWFTPYMMQPGVMRPNANGSGEANANSSKMGSGPPYPVMGPQGSSNGMYMGYHMDPRYPGYMGYPYPPGTKKKQDSR